MSYCYSVDGETYVGQFDFPIAIREALKNAKFDYFFIGRNNPIGWHDIIDERSILEDMFERASDRCLDTPEQSKFLDDIYLSEEKRIGLKAHVVRWFQDNSKINFFEVIEEKRYFVKDFS